MPFSMHLRYSFDVLYQIIISNVLYTNFATITRIDAVNIKYKVLKVPKNAKKKLKILLYFYYLIN